MVERTFRIVSDSREMLTAEVISLALMQNITLDPTKPDAAFAVMEIGKSRLEDGAAVGDISTSS